MVEARAAPIAAEACIRLVPVSASEPGLRRFGPGRIETAGARADLEAAVRFLPFVAHHHGETGRVFTPKAQARDLPDAPG